MAIETRNYIAGDWLAGDGEVERRNPSDTGDLIGRFAQASAAQLDTALAQARAAQPLWWAAGIQKRHDVLMAIGSELMARATEIGTLLSREEGVRKSIELLQEVAPSEAGDYKPQVF